MNTKNLVISDGFTVFQIFLSSDPTEAYLNVININEKESKTLLLQYIDVRALHDELEVLLKKMKPF